MVWGSERPTPNKSLVTVSWTASDSVDLTDGEELVQRRRGQQAWQATGEHGLARAWGPDQQEVVTSGSGYDQSTLGGLSAADVRKVKGVLAIRLA